MKVPLSFGVFLFFIHCGQLQVKSSVKPVYERLGDSRDRMPLKTLSRGPIKAPRTTAASLGALQLNHLKSPGASSKGKVKFRRQVKDNKRRKFTDWDGEAADGNGIEQERFPTLGDDVPSKIRPHKTSGEWATPPPDSDIDLGFTPVQTYIQVRKTNTVEHLPRSEAINEATSLDEVLNAHRLKEVLRTKKIQEVYSEEGYEDSAYDHGDHERHAEHDEGFAKAKDGKYKVKDPVQYVQDIADAESKVISKKNLPISMMPKVSRKRVEATRMKFACMDDDVKMKESDEKSGMSSSNIERKVPSRKLLNRKKQKRANKYSSQIKTKQLQHDKQSQIEMEPIQQQEQKLDQYRQPPPSKRDFVSPKGDFWSLPSVFEELTKSTKWGSSPAKIPKTESKEDQLPKTGSGHVRIAPFPTFGYIHSLTNAHYGTQAPMVRHTPKPIPSHVINLTDSLQPAPKESYPGFEPRRLSKRIKREDQGSSAKETEEYEKELSKELDHQEKNIIKEALSNLNVKDIAEGLPKSRAPKPFSFKPSIPLSWRNTYDTYKYPYFFSKRINPYSPLRYASHPREFPRKSGYGMEFYESRDREIDCEPVSINLDNIPKSNSTRHLAKQPGKEKRIIALGDKIQCLKTKYFGEDPLDSPFFKEDELQQEPSNVKPQLDEVLKYHSTYHYQPNRTMDVFVKETTAERNNSVFNDSKEEGTQERVKYQTIQPVNAVNDTQNYRVIPVTENYIQITSAAPIRGMRPPPIIQRPFPMNIIRLPPRPRQSKNAKQRIHYSHNCLHPVTRMIVTERADEDHEVIFDCKDATFVETIRWDGNKHIKIFPKTRRSDLIDVLLDETNSLRAGEVIEGNSILLNRGKRATPSPMPRKKSKLFPNKSVLDRIVKKPSTKKRNQGKDPSALDLGDKSPEEIMDFEVAPTVVVTSPTTPKIKNPTSTTQSTTTAIQETRKIELKPLTRLTGKDFLDRYHKSKSAKASGKPMKKEFWKLPEKKVEVMEDPRPKVGEDRRGEEEQRYGEGQPSPTPVLFYIVDEATGRGQWVPEEVSDSPLRPSDPSTEGYAQINARQQKKQDARKKFFAKKLKKVL